jgi:hypothetical protein
MNLLARLERVEKSHEASYPWRNHRFCRTVTSEEQAEAARREVAAQGYDPNRDLLLIFLVESSGLGDELIVVRKP